MKIPKMLKILSVLLITVMVVQALPLTAFASVINELGYDYPESVTVYGNDEMFEDSEKRGLFSKQFRMSDGTYTAVVYNEQVHYENEEGLFEDIDNRLEYSKADDQYDFSGYENRSNAFKVRFSENTERGIIYRLNDKEISVGFGLYDKSGFNSTDVKIDQNDIKDPIIDFESDEIGSLRAVTSQVSYSSVYDGVDFVYRLSGTRIKDEIVINDKIDTYEFAFVLDLNNLTPEEDGLGGIKLVDGAGEVRYTISAPYMFDDAGAVSDDVRYEINGSEGSYILRVIASEEWINDEGRVFPITIDPELNYGAYQTGDVADSEVREGIPTTKMGAYEYMLTGYWASTEMKHMRIYSKLRTLPDIPKSSIIVNATLNLRQWQEPAGTTSWKRFRYSGDMSELKLAAREVTDIWYERSDESPTDVICWDDQPSFDTKIIDYKTVSQLTNGQMQHFDITSLAQQWHETGVCNGVAVFPVNEYVSGNSYAFANFYTRENPYQNETEPFYTFVYRDNKGIEDYWTFNSYNVGAAGTAYLNDFSGNTVFVGHSITADNEEMPFSIYPVYNAYQKGTQFNHQGYSVGYGWRLNIQEKIESTSIEYNGNTSYYFKYFDEDGTEHYFKLTDENEMTAEDEDDLGYEITYANNLYTLKNKNSDTVKIFDNTGKLLKIKYGEKTVQFNYSNNKLSSITYNSDTLFTFTVNSLTSLSQITADNGNTMSFKYSLSYNDQNSYSYYWGYLRKIDYTDTEYSSESTNIGIDYLQSSHISEIKDDNDSIVLTYENNRPSSITQAVISGSTYHTSNQVKTEYTGHLSTTYRTPGANCVFETSNTSSDDILTVYTFDNWGHTVNCVSYRADGKEFYGSVGYVYDNESHKYNTAALGKGGNININHNTLFDSVTGSSGTGYSILADQETKVLGKQSLKITATAHTSSPKVYTETFPYIYSTGYLVISGYIKTSGVSGSAYIAVKYSDSVVAQTPAVTGTTKVEINRGWQKVYAVMPVSYYYGYTIEYTLDSDDGSAWFDLIQIEYSENKVPGRQNLIKNGCFNSALITGWNVSGNISWLYSSIVPYNSYSIGLVGTTDNTVEVSQEIDVYASLDEDYVFCGWTKADSVHTDGSKIYAVESEITLLNTSTNATVTLAAQRTDINPDCHEWQYFAHNIKAVLVPNTDYSNCIIKTIKVKMLYVNNANTAYFTGLSLSRSTAVSNKYDQNSGNLDKKAITSGSDHYTINDDGSITKATNEQSYEYEYYDFGDPNKIKKETYSDGLVIEYFYDDNGFKQWSLNENNVFVPETIFLPNTIEYTIDGVLRNRYCYTYDSDHVTDPATGAERDVYWFCSNETLYKYDENGVLFEFKETDYITRIKDGERLELTNEICVKDCNGFFKSRQIFEYDTNCHLIKDEYRNVTEGVFYVQKYTYSGDNLTSETDRSGKTISYTYDSENRVSTKTDANGGVTTYTYDSDGNVASMNFSGGTIDTTVNYEYNDYGISGIDANTDYEFTYDAFGNKTGVKIVNGNNSLDLVTYVYNSNGTLYYKHYANGWYERYAYDNNGNVTKVFKETTLNSTQTSPEIENIYSDEGLLIEHRDNANGTKTVYEYNGDGEILRSVQYDLNNGTKLQTEIIYNGSNPERIRYLYENSEIDEISYKYDDNSLLIKYSTAAGETEFDYNVLDQLVSKAIETVNNVTLTETYTYKTTTIDNVVSTSDLIATVQLADGTVFGYTYDNVGNITSVTESGVLKASYVYDALGQLTRENNAYANKTYVFTYDNYGNILSKAEYAYTTGTLGTPSSTKTYTYGDSLWKDKLTAYNGVSITYDAMGNPLNYNNGDSYTFTWKNGRELATLSTGTTSVSYNYNADSVRIKKTVNGVVHEYVVDGYKILEEKYGSTVLKFTYDENDSPQSMSVNGTVYYYGKNLQGDIVKIYDASGNAIAGYTYDAWGNVISISYTNIYGMASANTNPFRYRGYYYDIESGLYYLNSRYYDAKVGRFINADLPSNVMLDSSYLFVNLFCYCKDNPINNEDVSGAGSVRFLAVGIQFAFQIGRISFGVELLWSTKDGSFYAFLYIGGSKQLGKKEKNVVDGTLSLVNKLKYAKSVKDVLKAFKPEISFYISFVGVLGNSYAQFPYNYTGWFSTLSISFKLWYINVNISGSYSESGKAKIGSFTIGAGFSSGSFSVSFSESFYFQLTGKNKDNNNDRVLREITNSLGILYLIYGLFG